MEIEKFKEIYSENFKTLKESLISKSERYHNIAVISEPFGGRELFLDDAEKKTKWKNKKDYP